MVTVPSAVKLTSPVKFSAAFKFAPALATINLPASAALVSFTSPAPLAVTEVRALFAPIVPVTSPAPRNLSFPPAPPVLSISPVYTALLLKVKVPSLLLKSVLAIFAFPLNCTSPTALKVKLLLAPESTALVNIVLPLPATFITFEKTFTFPPNVILLLPSKLISFNLLALLVPIVLAPLPLIVKVLAPAPGTAPSDLIANLNCSSPPAVATRLFSKVIFLSPALTSATNFSVEFPLPIT